MSLGEKIQVLLQLHGMEQQDLAKKLGVARSSVSDWVNGKTHPRHRRLAAIARALKTDVKKLVA